MGKPSVTIIVPVYNCASYVAECLESLKAQTHADFEAIVVDDGSQDDSLDRIFETIGEDARFTVLPQAENRGLSAVRNIGLEHAHGEYVVFLDSDDYLREDALQLLLERAQSQMLDDLFFNGESFYEERDLEGLYTEDFDHRDSFDDVYTGRELYASFVERDQFFTSAAMHMVRRSLIEDAGIRFWEGILHEDILFTFQVIALSQRSSFLNEPLYKRRWRADSIVTRGWTWRNIDGHFVSMYAIRRWMENHADSIDARFGFAVGMSLARWQHLCAEKWETDLDDVVREAYLSSLSSEERLAFCLDVLGSGGEAMSARDEFAESLAYRLGSAIAAFPRLVCERIKIASSSFSR